MAKKKNLDEITEVAESTNVIDASEVKIDADALCTVIERLYKYDNEKAMEYFGEANLELLNKHNVVFH